MTRSTLSHSVTPALTAWRNLVSNGPIGPGIDFTDTNRTHACEQQLDAFLTNPSPDTFRELWDGDVIASYWAPSAAVLLGSDSAVDSLHDVCGEMLDADAFDPTWLDRLAGSDPGWASTNYTPGSKVEPIPSRRSKPKPCSVHSATTTSGRLTLL